MLPPPADWFSTADGPEKKLIQLIVDRLVNKHDLQMQ